MLPVVARAAPHFGEEPCISGTRGSGTVFFCGCALGCVFCQNADISRAVPRTARTLDAGALGALFAELADKGVHNINLVTASHFVPVVAEALRRCPPGIPVVYNCGGYENVQTLRMLEGLVDVYLPDYKFADADTAAVCAQAPDYPQTALEAIVEMRRQTGEAVFSPEGILLRGTLVRHLVLPGLTGRVHGRADAPAGSAAGGCARKPDGTVHALWPGPRHPGTRPPAAPARIPARGGAYARVGL